MNAEAQHTPVLLHQVLELLDPQPDQHFLDCTVGGGGHAKSILEKTSPGGKLYGVDRDPYALDRAGQTLKPYSHRIQLVHGEFSNVSDLFPQNILGSLSGALMDCGVSSFQLDSQERGFSFRFEAPLDMRMNSKSSLSAKTFLQQADERELADIIYQLGEERNSRKIAKNIIRFRSQKKLNTTLDLAQAVIDAFPKRNYWKIHPATKTFQAIRMHVNDELGQIREGIQALLSNLQIGSKLVVITFHSLEDRLVKHAFRDAFKEKKVKWINKKPLIAERSEIQQNPRSRSAKVRGVEVIS